MTTAKEISFVPVVLPLCCHQTGGSRIGITNIKMISEGTMELYSNTDKMVNFVCMRDYELGKIYRFSVKFHDTIKGRAIGLMVPNLNSDSAAAPAIPFDENDSKTYTFGHPDEPNSFWAGETGSTALHFDGRSLMHFNQLNLTLPGVQQFTTEELIIEINFKFMFSRIICGAYNWYITITDMPATVKPFVYFNGQPGAFAIVKLEEVTEPIHLSTKEAHLWSWNTKCNDESVTKEIYRKLSLMLPYTIEYNQIIN